LGDALNLNQAKPATKQLNQNFVDRWRLVSNSVAIDEVKNQLLNPLVCIELKRKTMIRTNFVNFLPTDREIQNFTIHQTMPAVVSAIATVCFDQFLIEPFVDRTLSDDQTARYVVRAAVSGTIFYLTNHLSQQLFLPSPERLPEPLSAEMIQRMLEQSKLAKFYPPKRPAQSSAPNQDKCQQWVSEHPEALVEFAQKVINSISHVSQTEFEKALLCSVEDFNHHLSKLSKDQRAYTIVLAQNDARTQKEYAEMSNLWVTMLALPFLRYPPTQIVLARCHYGDCQKDIPTKKVLLFDDAAYSGSQIAETIEGLHLDQSTKVYCVIPFLTKRAEQKLHDASVWIAEHQEMAVLYSRLNDSEKENLKRIPALNTHPRPERLAITYFDHKMADLWSVLTPILVDGYLLHGEKKIPFIPEINPPYKEQPN
jgi:hypothetical protein